MAIGVIDNVASVDITHGIRQLHPTILEPFIWRYALTEGRSSLSFMESTVRDRQDITEVWVDGALIPDVPSLAALRALPPRETGWTATRDSMCVKHAHGYSPTWSYITRTILVQRIANKPRYDDGGHLYDGILHSVPSYRRTVDAFSYAMMSFLSGSVVIDNSDGKFDDVHTLVGNDMVVRQRYSDDAHSIEKRTSFYVANVQISARLLTIIAKDRRANLVANVAGEKFTADEFPFMDEALLDTDKQEAFGYCIGVPAVCLNGKQIYRERLPGTPDLPDKVATYTYRISGGYVRVDRIWVEMTRGTLPADPANPTGERREVDGWTLVFDRSKMGGEWSGNGGWLPGITPGFLLWFGGEISLDWRVAKKAGRRENDMNAVRVDGWFGDVGPVSTLRILQSIVNKWGNIPFTPERWDIEETTAELDKLQSYPIGVFVEKSTNLFSVLEKLQSASVVGFQIHDHDTKMTARLDNPNRPPSFEITHADITNIDEIIVDYNTTLYGTSTNIAYAHDHALNTARHYTYDGARLAIQSLFGTDKEWEQKTGLVRKEDARIVSEAMTEEFLAYAPIVRNIRLIGVKWHSLRIYDTGFISARLDQTALDNMPQYVATLFRDAANAKRVGDGNGSEVIVPIADRRSQRTLMANIRCQITSLEITDEGVTVLSVRIRRANTVLQAEGI